nr:radical SAM protein [Desulfobacterales bacterium]
MKREDFVTAVVANKNGEVFDVQGFAAVGMAGDNFVVLSRKDTVSLPGGSELLFLPDRRPIVFNIDSGRFEILYEHPYLPAEPVFPVAAFNAPGYVITRICAYEEEPDASPLPLFAYGAVGWKNGRFRASAFCIDRERRQNINFMNIEKMLEGIEKLRKRMPRNRLRRHLENCALNYGCPAAKNFFLHRYEAPLPTSTRCNARCWGCLSLQEGGEITSTQDRICFTPSPDEIAEIAVYHILNTRKRIVSFGQGCEGEPLLAADVIEPALKLIRKETRLGTINMNTNASLPSTLDRLFEAGLDSIRVSMNSVREECYTAYFRPRGYSFNDVIQSIDLAAAKGRFVSINYMNMPGFTDTKGEVEALLSFLEKHQVRMIQWRNLNLDPLRYWRLMGMEGKVSEPIGMSQLVEKIQKKFSGIKHGYFNPEKGKM